MLKSGQAIVLLRVWIPDVVKHRLVKVCDRQDRTVQAVTHEALVRYLDTYDQLQERKTLPPPENMPPSNI